MTVPIWNLAALTLLVSACVVDQDDRCGEHQVLAESGACICAEGYVLGAEGCAKCGDACAAEKDPSKPPKPGEQPQPSDGGDTRFAADSGSKSETPAAGGACKTAGDCQGKYNTCREEPGAGIGYCTTQNCSNNSDCPSAFRCQQEVSPSFCKRPPTGDGAPCDVQEDCAGFDAWACNTFQHVCVVIDCLVNPDASCFEGYTCCDFSSLGAPSLCLAAEGLPEGKCPF